MFTNYIMSNLTWHVDEINQSQDIECLNMKIAELESIVKRQADEIEENKKKPKWSDMIDDYVDKWYENNKDEVDIGRIELWNLFGYKKEIDIMPDNVEKHMYKKIMKIMFSFITSPNQ